MAANKRNLLLLFDRPLEPVFMEKGKNNAKFDVPSQLLNDRYKNNPSLQERFGENAGERIPVRNISIPNLKVPMSLGRDEQFSLFIPRHRRIASHMINIFMSKFNQNSISYSKSDEFYFFVSFSDRPS